MSNPSVTIPITSYNQLDYLVSSVESAVKQDYDNLLVTVYDDASTDGSQEYLREMAQKYPDRLKVHFNQERMGGERNRTQSVMLTDSKYVTYLDGDDMYLPGKIRKQVDYLEAHPEFDFIYHDVEAFDSKTNKPLFNWRDRFGYGEGNLKKITRYGFGICSLSIMFRRKLFNGYVLPNNIINGSDWFLSLYALAMGSGDYGYMDDVLARYRRHS